MTFLIRRGTTTDISLTTSLWAKGQDNLLIESKEQIITKPWIESVGSSHWYIGGRTHFRGKKFLQRLFLTFSGWGNHFLFRITYQDVLTYGSVESSHWYIGGRTHFRGKKFLQRLFLTFSGWCFFKNFWWWRSPWRRNFSTQQVVKFLRQHVENFLSPHGDNLLIQLVTEVLWLS